MEFGVKLPPMLVSIGQACYQCFKEKSKVPLQRCSGCLHVYYCGSGEFSSSLKTFLETYALPTIECQRTNWPKHKALCKAFKAVETKDANNLLAPYMFIDDDDETYVATDIDQVNKCIGAVIQTEMRALERELLRSLRMEERNLIGWEPHCLACGRSDAIFRIEASLRKRKPLSPGLKPCPDCLFTSYCCEEHWDAVKEKHKREPCRDGRDNLSQCDMNKLYLEDIRFAMVMSGANEGTFKWAPERTLRTWKSLRGIGWSDYSDDIEQDFGGLPGVSALLPNLARAATDGLSMPMTILWALENLNNDDSWTKKDTLNIHILGPAEKEILNANVFEEILHRLPLVKNLTLTLVGPELAGITGQKQTSNVMKTCPACTRSGRKRTFIYYPTTYHQYVSESGTNFVNPDLAVAFNSGCSQEYTDLWKESLVVLIKHRIPAVFTAFNQEEAEAEANIFRDVGATLHPQLGPRANPWGSCLAIPEPNKVTGFYAVNGWLAGGFR
uniref:Mitochondrial splicing suppressor 51-like C-terminal domain-containing protein n=1 Tax=Psilocybe cubensis TaxID=181762 RepID=A0A8H7XLM9_PSICU